MARPDDYNPKLDDIRFVGGRPLHYKLVDRVAVPCSPREWVSMSDDDARRQVALDAVERPDSDPVMVSTVFLGIDHGGWFFDGPPILFETMVFGGTLDQHIVRYATYVEATRGHAELLAEVKAQAALTAQVINERIATILARSKQEH